MGSGQSKDKKDKGKKDKNKKKDKEEPPKRDTNDEKKNDPTSAHPEPELEASPPPPPPPEDELYNPKIKENEDKIIPVIDHDDDAEEPHEDDGEPHVVEGDEFKIVMGRECHQTLDTRTNKPEKTEPPQVADGNLWVDGSFPYEVAMEGQDIVEWKRPGVSHFLIYFV